MKKNKVKKTLAPVSNAIIFNAGLIHDVLFFKATHSIIPKNMRVLPIIFILYETRTNKEKAIQTIKSAGNPFTYLYLSSEIFEIKAKSTAAAYQT